VRVEVVQRERDPQFGRMHRAGVVAEREEGQCLVLGGSKLDDRPVDGMGALISRGDVHGVSHLETRRPCKDARARP
jgi:hypothetical protein